MTKLLSILLIIGTSFSLIFQACTTQDKTVQNRNSNLSAPPLPLETHTLKPFMITTRDDEPHVIKITMRFGFYDNKQTLQQELIRRNKQIRNIVYLILLSKRYQDFSSVQSTITLQDEIKSSLNAILMQGSIKEIYFIEFLVN